MSEIAELARKFNLWTPTYGVCGGQALDCAVKRQDLDPMDQLFYDHDNACSEAMGLKTDYEVKIAKGEADAQLKRGLANLTDQDMKKIPFWTWKKPFFKRWYAEAYRKACLKIF